MTMSGQNKVILNFDHTMNDTDITLNDMSVSVSSSSYISTSLTYDADHDVDM